MWGKNCPSVFIVQKNKSTSFSLQCSVIKFYLHAVVSVSLYRGFQGFSQTRLQCTFTVISPAVHLHILASVEFLLLLVLSLLCIFWFLFLCSCRSTPLGYLSFFLFHFQDSPQIPSVIFLFSLAKPEQSLFTSELMAFIACSCLLTLIYHFGAFS